MNFEWRMKKPRWDDEHPSVADVFSRKSGAV